MAHGEHAILEGGRELPFLSQQNTYLGSILQRILDAVNLTAKNAGVSSVGKIAPPDPVDSVNIQGTQLGSKLIAPSEILHLTLTHNGPVKKNVQYITEVATDSNFSNPHIIDHGCSRSAFVHLPTYLDDGVTKQIYYVRSYPQYPGSDPARPTVFGGLAQPIQVQMTGSSAGTLLQSTGSGTASPTGNQGGHGLGKILDRPATGPKRNLV
jgi:hypothetical protein